MGAVGWREEHGDGGGDAASPEYGDDDVWAELALLVVHWSVSHSRELLLVQMVLRLPCGDGGDDDGDYLVSTNSKHAGFSTY